MAAWTSHIVSTARMQKRVNAGVWFSFSLDLRQVPAHEMVLPTFSSDLPTFINLDNPQQACPEICLHGNPKLLQVDKISQHTMQIELKFLPLWVLCCGSANNSTNMGKLNTILLLQPVLTVWPWWWGTKRALKMFPEWRSYKWDSQVSLHSCSLLLVCFNDSSFCCITDWG